jgi:hypothetical protein
MREHDCLGAAMRRAGEQPECPALMPGFKGLIIRTPRGPPTVAKDGPDLAGLGGGGARPRPGRALSTDLDSAICTIVPG